MKKRQYIIFGLVVLSGIAGYYLFNREEEAIETTSYPVEEKAKILSQQNDDDVSSNEKQLQETYDLTDKEARLFSLLDEAFAKADGPVVFYGKVIDQNNDPVVGATVEAKILYYGGFSLLKMRDGDDNDKYHSSVLTTDSSGKFTVSGNKGKSLDINISKEGYKSPEGRLSYVYDPNERKLRHHPSPGNPVILTMWKKGKIEEGLIKRKILFKFDSDGTEQGVSLIDGKWLKTNITDAALIVSVAADIPEGTRPRRYNWSLTIDVPNGGIIETSDAFLYQAPEEGYQNPYTLTMSADDSKWRGDISNKKFYVKARNGDIYASIILGCHSYSNNKALVKMKTFVNPNGSRNLEH